MYTIPVNFEATVRRLENEVATTAELRRVISERTQGAPVPSRMAAARRAATDVARRIERSLRGRGWTAPLQIRF